MSKISWHLLEQMCGQVGNVKNRTGVGEKQEKSLQSVGLPGVGNSPTRCKHFYVLKTAK